MEPIDHVRRWSAAEKEYLTVCRPACVQVYNEFMGGVDKLDSLISYYRIRGKTKNGLSIYHFVNFALANSWLEYRNIKILNGKRKFHEFLSFRNEVADVLLKAKLDPPSVEMEISVGRLCTASSDKSENLQRGNRPSTKRLHPFN